MSRLKELVELFPFLENKLLTRLLDFQCFAWMGMAPGVDFGVVCDISYAAMLRS
jgi:hypothetical protein